MHSFKLGKHHVSNIQDRYTIGLCDDMMMKSVCKIAKKLRDNNKKAQLFLLILNSAYVFCLFYGFEMPKNASKWLRKNANLEVGWL